MDIDELEKIISVLKRNDVTEFELNEGGLHIKLQRGSTQILSTPVPSIVSLEPAVMSTVPALISGGSAAIEGNGSAAAISSNWHKVESPIVGTFYRKPNPEAAPFVSEGTMVKKGDTLCIIEAMKLMNEIEAPISGRVEKIFLNDGQVVEYGEVLFYLNPSAAAG